MYSQIDSNKRKTALLIAIFLALIISIAWFLQWYYHYGYSLVAGAVVFSALMSLAGYYKADALALWSTGAKPIQKEDAPILYRTVENVAITAGIPMPKIYIIHSDALNAFATGRDPAHASIAVTTGLLNALETTELQGVIGHEISHIQNYDIRVMTVVVVLVGIVALIADWFIRISWFGRGNQRRSDHGGKIGGVIAILGIIFLILSPIIAELIKLAISRRREYLADASGSLLTRYPEGLARALTKMQHSAVPLRTASTATAHLFIVSPFLGKKGRTFFSTHPPIEDRIKRLRDMIA